VTITSHLFEAYLKCPTKSWLRSQDKRGDENAHADWERRQSDCYRSEGIKRLLHDVAENDRVTSPPSTDILGTAGWRLAVDLLAQGHEVESALHAMERMPSKGRGKSGQFMPIRFVFTNKVTKDERLRLAFDALVLSEMLGRDVSPTSTSQGVESRVFSYLGPGKE